ncbi:uncharacterized protein LOC131168394 [Malania oleifera]|uniref:uncharacterized protein LOC131168394 n=1 Tax=Malania oleifera TaxID=397392 RepID=UPI0025AE7B39|nr:uncharacterized protein LOC131168394 [Malania oleifera]
MSTFGIMPSEFRSKSGSVGSNGGMGCSSELRLSSKHYQTPNVMKEKSVPCSNQRSKFHNKLRVEYPSGHPYIDLLPGIKQNVDDEIVVPMKSSEGHQKQRVRSKETKDDELVKYMSNLPGYLQHMDRADSHKEKAFNFGVLDWERLEKWKHKQKHSPARHSMNASTPWNASSSTVFGETLARQSKQRVSFGSEHDLSRVERLYKGAKLSQEKVMNAQDYETPTKSSLGVQQKIHVTANSPGRNSVIMTEEKRKDINQKITTEMATSLSNSRNNGVSLSSKKKIASRDSESKKESEELQEFDFDFAQPHRTGKHQNIVLLLPKDLPRNSCSELLQLSEPRTSFDKRIMNASRKSFSGGFPQGGNHSGELYSEISHSCPLPCGGETSAQGVGFPSDAYQTPICSKEKISVQHKGKYAEESKAKRKPSNSNVIEAYRRSDREHADLSDARGRNPSPNRRFGIGLSRMSRSFSLKESAAVPQLISTYMTVKSGPVKSEAASCSDDSNREKAHAHGRSRSSPSPLRRLLDPLLKPKVANFHSADMVQPLEGKPIDAFESLETEKHVTRSVHALLQLATKNGLPLFKFVVDDNSNILATTVKKITESGKDDSSLIYTFYSVREIKRKKSGGWMNQGSKGKGSGYVYNVVGQMKISESKDQNLVRESVLSSVELGHTDQETPASMPNQELAAIVVKIPRKSAIYDVGVNNEHVDLTEIAHAKCSPEDESFSTSEENARTNSTTVILPNGIHGLPNKGVPSRLIDRWKSGGSCDCGGWDVGCKLRVFTNQDPCCEVLGPSKARPSTTCFDLFVQGGIRENRPVFSLVPFKNGIYSVKFNASISLLQAFSICIAVLNSQKASDLSETSNPLEARNLQGQASAGVTRTCPTTVQGEAPMKYASYPPPLSPVGRV